MQWYYSAEGEQKGPFSDAEFLKLVNTGVVKSSTLVWNETMTDWQPQRNVKDVLDSLSRQGKGEAEANAQESVVCNECGSRFSKADVIEYRGVYVCGGCKPAFFQRIEEGGAVVSCVGGKGETPNRDLMASARAALSGNWGIAIGFFFLFNMLSQVFSLVIRLPLEIGPAAGASATVLAIFVLLMLPFFYFLSGALQVGYSRFFLDLARGDMVGIGRMFYGFRIFWKAGGAFLLMVLYICLWSLLFIIPGILAAFSYAMVFFVLADNPDLSITEALSKSKKMMKGNRWKYFCLSCRFIGWSILAVFTCFIGFLWLAPYVTTSYAKFYDDVRGLAS